jgi:hypothetical protein
MPDDWHWFEAVALASDLVGLIGALLLAWPFYNSQSHRDKLIALDLIDVPDPRDAVHVKQVRLSIARTILGVAHNEYRIGVWGAVALGLAFVGKLGATSKSITFTVLAMIIFAAGIYIFDRRHRGHR